MKKIISFTMAVVILACTLWFSTGSATAAGTITYLGARFVWGKGVVFIFEASGYRNRDVKGATLSIGSSSFDVHCTVNKKAGKIICVAGGGLTQYTGQTGILYLAGHAFYVVIPARPLLPSGSGSAVPLSCPPGTEPGADVTFLTGGGDHHTEFIPGATLGEVSQQAESMTAPGGDWTNVLSIGSLYCNQRPN